MRVCCWLEVTRWGLLISPWFTVMAGLRVGKEASAGTPGASPSTPRMALPSPGSTPRLQHWAPAATQPWGSSPAPSLSWGPVAGWGGLLSARGTECQAELMGERRRQLKQHLSQKPKLKPAYATSLASCAACTTLEAHVRLFQPRRNTEKS